MSRLLQRGWTPNRANKEMRKTCLVLQDSLITIFETFKKESLCVMSELGVQTRRGTEVIGLACTAAVANRIA